MGRSIEQMPIQTPCVLSTKETELLRSLYWKLQEAQGELNRALNEVAKAHGVNVDKEQANVTSDFKWIVK